MAGRNALWATGHDESVEVNQRALIDKVLARYSGEFTVFRELLQNSDDARAKSVEIRFETQEYVDYRSGKGPPLDATIKLPDLKKAPVCSWTLKNNGEFFREEDWSRLKKIAEGNPDEDKIGAFGVGFYSLFSVTEEPFVTSGGQWMGFHWKDGKDQLFARRGELPPPTGETISDPWTSFEMSLREPAPIPAAFDFTRFLSSSLTFMISLSEISVYFDDKRLSHLTKSSGMPQELSIPRGLHNISPAEYMTVTALRSTDLHISASVARWVYSAGTEKPPPPIPKITKPAAPESSLFSARLTTFFGGGWSRGVTPVATPPPLPEPPVAEVDPMTISDSSVTLSVFTAVVGVKMNSKMESELHRSTKKKPPSKLSYQLIYTGKDEYDKSVKEDEDQPFATGSVFQGLRADLTGSGSARIFIGHATGQTTGLGGHMSSRFIPTVERESIDLVDRHVATWNRDLLYVGGFLARAAYELELASVHTLWTNATAPASTSGPEPEVQEWLRGRALHALKFFTFYSSTPSSDVSSLLQSAFFLCGKGCPMSIMSTEGVRDATKVRVPNPQFARFLKQLPVVPPDIATQASTMVTAMQQRGLLADIGFPDVLGELRNRPLDEGEMIACLQWWVSMQRDDQHSLNALIEAAVLTIGAPGSADERIIPLSSVKTFIAPKNMGSIIPQDTPLPDHVLPLSVSKFFSPETLTKVYSWRELSLLDWARFLVDPSMRAANGEFDICLNAAWAEKVLLAISRVWPALSNPSKKEVVTVLWSQTCIPTSAGMKRPEEAYFANANVFPDLPIVHFGPAVKIKGAFEAVLQTLGVRKHVDLQIVFDRMVKPGAGGAETTRALVAYLVDVQATLNQDEMTRLRGSQAFAAESKEGTKFRASELYEPTDVLRQLGLPVLDWGKDTKWRPFSTEATFLKNLGLRTAPPAYAVIPLCASVDAALRPVAFKYLLDHMETHYKGFDVMEFRDVAFIPALKGTTACMATPGAVYRNQEWVKMGFMVVHPTAPAAISKLSLREHPTSAELINLLLRLPPKDHAQAQQWFELLASRISEFSQSQKITVSNMKIVPTLVKSEKGEVVRLLPPSQCFLAGDNSAEFHSKLFVFVDFKHKANAFLSACGTNPTPSVEQIVQILLKDPREFYSLAATRENFLTELRNIAINANKISQPTFRRMRRSPILLASQRKSRPPTEKTLVEVDEEEWELQYDLQPADHILICDDTVLHQFFGDSVFVAPQEDILEDFYLSLGSSRLSQAVKEDHKTSQELIGSREAGRIRTLILERLPLFLVDESIQSRTRFNTQWLNVEGHFVVKSFGKIAVTKSLNYGGASLTRKENAFATAKRVGSGPVQLWIAENERVDLYEVSTSLCRLMFKAPKASDALLFWTILSTDLNALKRRGFNVDRIMHKHRTAAALAAGEQAKVRAADEALMSQTKENAKGKEVALPTTSTKPMVPTPSLPPSAPPTGVESPFVPSSKGNQVSNFMSSVKDNFKQNSRFGPFGNKGGSDASGSSPQPSGQERQHNQAVTPLSNIASNIDQAIKACASERSGLLHNREHMEMVKESLNDGYCDLSGHISDMASVGNMAGVSVYVAQDIPNPAEFMIAKRETLQRFMTVIQPLSGVYAIPLTNLHIFCDASGPTIAFNRGGSVFFNLRFYETWHDQEVQRGQRTPAFISWYFTLAHEIAHNLVLSHNSEHEFYFSAIAEKHLLNLSKILA